MNVTDFTLLLVEDDPNDILLIQRAMSKGGLVNPLRVVRDGEEAVAGARRGRHEDERAESGEGQGGRGVHGGRSLRERDPRTARAFIASSRREVSTDAGARPAAVS